MRKAESGCVSLPRLDIVVDTACSGKACNCRHAQRRASITAALPPLPQIASTASTDSAHHSRHSISDVAPVPDDVGYQQPLFHLQVEELRRLPVSEALRHVLMERSGGLEQAFLKMDVNRCGEVNFDDFVAGLQALGFSQRSPLADVFPDLGLRELFKKAGPHHGRLSLHDFLGFVPVDGRDEGTCTQWFTYHNKTSTVPTALVRKPGWRAKVTQRSGSMPSLTEEPSPADAHENNRRRLKIKIRQNRDAGVVAQRGLVRGLIPMQGVQEKHAAEKQAAEKWKRRIEGEIRECGKVRMELAEVRGKLAEVTRNALLQEEFAEVAIHLQGLREGLKFQRHSVAFQ